MHDAAIIPKRGVMRHLEDDTTKDFRNTPSTHAHMWNERARTHTLPPFVEKQLGDKQSGRVRDGAREEERE